MSKVVRELSTPLRHGGATGVRVRKRACTAAARAAAVQARSPEFALIIKAHLDTVRGVNTPLTDLKLVALGP